jgi:hypothetical protein
MKENKMQNTKKIKELVEAVKQVAEKKIGKNFKRGDALVWDNVTYNVVEVLAPDRWHIKNVNAPFNSMIITEADLEIKGEE